MRSLLPGLLAFAVAACATEPRLLVPVVRKPETVRPTPFDKPAIPPPRADAAEAPPGFRVEVVAAGLVYPTSVEFDGRGGLYVAEAGYVYGDHWSIPRILHLGADGTRRVLTTALQGPVTDLLRHDGRLYVIHQGRVSVVDSDGTVRDLVTGLPTFGDHHGGQLAAGPDGRIYFGVGTVTNSGVVGLDNFLFLWLPVYPGLHDAPARPLRLRDQTFLTANPFIFSDAEEPTLVRTAPFARFGGGMPADGIVPGTPKPGGAIFRMRPDGSGLEVHAWGLRNPFGLAWSPDGRLIAADQGYDERGSRPVGNAPDVLWSIRRDGWYGWPDFVAGLPVTDDRFVPKVGPRPEFLLAEHPPVEKPLLTRPPHSASGKMDFSRDPAFGPPGSLFIAESGSMTPLTGPPSGRPGFQVVRVDPAPGGSTTFFRARPDALGPPGYEHALTAGPRRPVDAAFSPDGRALYVVDLGVLDVLETTLPLLDPRPGTGVLWRIVPDDAEGLTPPARRAAE